MMASELIALVLMIAAAAWMYVNQTLAGFFILGGLAGFALTGVQSVNRATVELFAPEGKSAGSTDSSM